MNTEISSWYNTSNVRAIKPFRWPRWLYRPVNNLWWRESWGNSVYTRSPSFEFQFRWLIKPGREKRRKREREKKREKQSESFFFPSTMRSIENEEVTQTGRYITLVCISWWEQWFISGFSHRGRRWEEGETRESGKVFSFLYTCDFWWSVGIFSIIVNFGQANIGQENFEENVKVTVLYLFWNL